MAISRQNLKRGGIALVALAVVGLLGLFVKLYNDTSPGKGAAAAAPSPSPSSTDGLGIPKASGSARPGQPAGSSRSGVTTVFPPELTRQLGGRTVVGTPHTVVLTVTAASPLAALGYLVPTADNPYGVIKPPTTPWRLTTTAYGNSYLAGIFVQAGRDAGAVTCTVAVDGVVRETNTTTKAYEKQLCIG